MNKTRVHLIIKGKVQGVCFRAETRGEALRLNLRGWVKNCSDGSVEAMAEGEEDKIEKFIQWCHQGPTRAKVESVEIKKEKFQGEYLNFSIDF